MRSEASIIGGNFTGRKSGTKRRRFIMKNFNSDGDFLSYLRNVRTTKGADRCADRE